MCAEWPNYSPRRVLIGFMFYPPLPHPFCWYIMETLYVKYTSLFMPPLVPKCMNDTRLLGPPCITGQVTNAWSPNTSEWWLETLISLFPSSAVFALRTVLKEWCQRTILTFHLPTQTHILLSWCQIIIRINLHTTQNVETEEILTKCLQQEQEKK